MLGLKESKRVFAAADKQVPRLLAIIQHYEVILSADRGFSFSINEIIVTAPFNPFLSFSLALLHS
ncbi:hypothetical protein QY97_03552 [Bacillus thermotolerans]|nr:hypothetical protein QY97_03552 [Bacillus thermotolerans]